MNEMQALNERLSELNAQIRAEDAKKNDHSKDLMGKISVEDKLEDSLRSLTQKISQLEKIEYPGENEREMLVSLRGNHIS